MKRKALAVFMTTAVVISSMAGCGVSTGSSNSKEEETTGSAADDTSNTADSENQESEDTTTDDGEDVTKASDDSMKDREEINLWFWGAEPYAQDAMKKYLVDEYNASQDKYQLVVEYISVRPGPAAFFQVGGDPGGKPAFAVEIPVVSVELQPGGCPLFLLFGRVSLGRVHRGPFSQSSRQSQAEQQKEPEGGSHGHHLLSVVSYIILYVR